MKIISKLLFMITLISCGYIFIVQNSNVSAIERNDNLDVYFTNVDNIQKYGYAKENGKGLYKVKIDDYDNSKIDFNISLRQPADKYSFTVDIKNNSDVPIKINIIANELDDISKEFINFYISGISEDEVLDINESKTVMVTIEYKPELTYLPEKPFTTDYNVTIDACQFL